MEGQKKELESDFDCLALGLIVVVIFYVICFAYLGHLERSTEINEFLRWKFR